MVFDLADRHQSLARLHVEMRHRLEQRLQVGMLRLVEDVPQRAALHDRAVVGDHHLLGDVGDDAQVVGDDQHRHVQLGLQVLDDFQDLRLDGDVQRGARFVGDQQGGAAHQRHGDHRPLAHAAGKLVRVFADPLCRFGNSDGIQKVAGRIYRLGFGEILVQTQAFGDLPADGVDRIERCHRVLEDHRDVLTPDLFKLAFFQSGQIAPLKVDAVGAGDAVPGRQAEDRMAGGAFPAAAFTDDPMRYAPFDGERDVANGLHHLVLGAEGHVQIFDFQQDVHKRRPGGAPLWGAVPPCPVS